MISSIYRQGPSPNPRPAHERDHENRARLWRDLGVVVIDPSDIADDWFAQAVKSHAIEKYGRRPK